MASPQSQLDEFKKLESSALHYALVIKREKFTIRHAVVAVAGTYTYETHRAS